MGLNSGWVWWQVPLPTEPYHQPLYDILTEGGHPSPCETFYWFFYQGLGPWDRLDRAWLSAQVYPSVPAQFSDLPLAKCWLRLLQIWEKNEQVTHNTRLKVRHVLRKKSSVIWGQTHGKPLSPMQGSEAAWRRLCLNRNLKILFVGLDCPLVCRIW